ncbi:hypothetical protein CRUP_036918, partial [Coryphaenoides rupestris]
MGRKDASATKLQVDQYRKQIGGFPGAGGHLVFPDVHLRLLLPQPEHRVRPGHG